MATGFHDIPMSDGAASGLSDPRLAIAGPRADALLIWGSPVIAYGAVAVYFMLARAVSTVDHAAAGLVAGVAVLTYAHLVAVVPRAYLNRDVFAAHRTRLTVMPVVLIAAMLVSTPVFVLCLVAAILWDVHHSAMQTFGLGRIYDMRAGNGATVLRRTDLLLNSALYIGPLAAGAALLAQVHPLQGIGAFGWTALTRVPPLVEGWAGPIHVLAVAGWLTILAAAAAGYARAIREGRYVLPAPKAALLVSTGAMSIVLWICSPPLIAFAVTNIYHAAQYFTMVWLKEGRRIAGLGRGGERPATPIAFTVFFALCIGFGLAYWATSGSYRTLLAPFIACSLLHFWFDGFVWSVRRKLV